MWQTASCRVCALWLQARTSAQTQPPCGARGAQGTPGAESHSHFSQGRAPDPCLDRLLLLFSGLPSEEDLLSTP